MVSPEHPIQPTSDPFVGTPYVALERLGAGSMGEVFLVQHREIGRRFVAKVQHAWLNGHQRTAERMRIEAEGLGNLRHVNIVSIAGYDHLPDGRPFILMEHLRGRTLREELLARGRLPVLEALTYACQLLSGLAAAHSIGIVHRDIKPDNLFLQNGRRTVLKVLDFGVARVASESSPVRPLPDALLTQTGQVIGNLPYQSPEGATGAHVDARADLYSAALVLYAMLAGRGPFDHVDDSMILHAHVEIAPEAPSHYATDPIPAELDAAILRALAKDPNQRFQTADEFRAELARIARSLGLPPGWLETTTFSPDGEPADSGRPLPAAGTPGRGVAAHPSAGEDGPASESDAPLSARSQALLFIAAALVTAALVTAVIFVLRGGS